MNTDLAGTNFSKVNVHCHYATNLPYKITVERNECYLYIHIVSTYMLKSAAIILVFAYIQRGPQPTHDP